VSGVAAHGAGGRGVGQRRRARDRAAVVSACQRAGGEASRKPRARARPQQHVRDGGEMRAAVTRARSCAAESTSGRLGLLPPPLWGRVGEGGDAVMHRRCPPRPPPPLTPPHKGEGNTPSPPPDFTTACGRFPSRGPW